METRGRSAAPADRPGKSGLKAPRANQKPCPFHPIERQQWRLEVRRFCGTQRQSVLRPAWTCFECANNALRAKNEAKGHKSEGPDAAIRAARAAFIKANPGYRPIPRFPR